MGKRTKQFEAMMRQFTAAINQAQQPNQWEIALGNEVNRRNAMSSKDIMAENLGQLSDWQRRYQAGVTPGGSIRNKGYQMQMGMAKDLGAEELARDYGRLGEQSVTNYRNQTLGLMGNQQQTAAQRMWNAANAYGGGAQMWSSFKPGGGWFEGLQKAIGLGSQVAGMLFGGA